MSYPKKTCATCKHIGGHYWGDYDRQEHHCGKSAERRRDAMKPTGDIAQDFMDNFRRFFDASANQSACVYYEEAEAIDGADMLSHFDASGKAYFRCFTDESSKAERHCGVLFKRLDYHNDQKREDGHYKAFALTNVGRAIRDLNAAKARGEVTP